MKRFLFLLVVGLLSPNLVEAKFLKCDVGMGNWQIYYNYANSEVYRYNSAKGLTDFITQNCQCDFTCRYGEGSPKGPISVRTLDDSYRLRADYTMRNQVLGNTHYGSIVVGYDDKAGVLKCQQLGEEGYKLSNCTQVDSLP